MWIKDSSRQILPFVRVTAPVISPVIRRYQEKITLTGLEIAHQCHIFKNTLIALGRKPSNTCAVISLINNHEHYFVTLVATTSV